MFRTTSRRRARRHLSGRAVAAVLALLLAEVLVPLLAATPAFAVVATTVTVTSNVTSAVTGQSVTFTARVATNPAGGTPTGTVKFTNTTTATVLCDSVTLSSGSATCSTTTLKASKGSPQVITADYTADSAVYDNSTGAMNQPVTAANTTTAVTSPVSPWPPGSNITFTAQVSASSPGSGTPTGAVAFTANDAPISGCGAAALNGTGAATCTTQFASAATYTVKGTYAGTLDYTTSNGSMSQVIGAVSTTTTVTSTNSTPVYGQTFDLAAHVVNSGIGVPTGAVEFSDNNGTTNTVITGCGSVNLDNNGNATCSVPASFVTTGSHTYTAHYGSDPNNNASSGTLTQTVAKADTTTAVASNSPTKYGQAATITATVAAKAPGTGAPTGTVDFSEGNVKFSDCTAVPLSTTNGVTTATCSLSTLSAGDHTIAASYNGSANFNTSSKDFVHHVDQAATQTTLAASASPAVWGEEVTFTATAMPVTPGGGTVTGTMTFYDVTKSTAVCTMEFDGTAVCKTTALSVGTHTVKAMYTATTNYAASESATTDMVINKADTATTIASSKPTSEYAEAVTFTATVAPVAPGGGIPAGTVDFFDGATKICSAVSTDTKGQAACATTTLTVGSHSVKAVFTDGDGDYNGSESSPITQTVGVHPTSTALTVSPASPSQYNDLVTFTATVSATTQGVSPPTTGTVNFLDGATSVSGCSAKTVTNGVATCPVSSLSITTHSITAVFNADGANDTYGQSTSSAVSYTVNKDATNTTASATSPASPSVKGQTVTLHASISTTHTGTPGGTVTFSSTNGGGDLAGCVNVAVSNLQASCDTNALPVGTDTVTATYTGDDFFASSSGSFSYTVSKAGTTTVVTADKANSVKGEPVKFTATVTINAPGSGTLAGTVNFVDASNGDAPLCTAIALTSGTADCPVSDLAVGAHNVKATYSGNADFNGSSNASPYFLETVAKAGTTTALATSAPNGALLNQSVTFTATVSVNSPGAGTPTGNVKFADDNGTISGCSAAAVSTTNGVTTATCTTSWNTRGTKNVTATYLGDSNFNTSNATVAQEIGDAPSTTTLTSSDNAPVATEPVTLTATITSGAPLIATGTVTFTEGATTLCSAVSLSSGKATCAVNDFSIATHDLTASYSGDANFKPSSGTLSLTVTKASAAIALASSHNPSVFGQATTYTATVTPASPATGSPTGTVTFTQDGGPLCANVALSGTDASCTPSGLTVGDHPVVASYSGDSTFNAGTAGLTQTVNKAATSTSVTSSHNPSVAGEQVTLTATVAITSPGAGTLSGSVTFTDGGAELCPNVSLDASGTASCTAPLTKATHTIVASYSGDGHFLGSDSPEFQQFVNNAPTTTALTSSPSPSVFGQAVTFTATVTPNAPATGTPTGTVTFSEGQTTLCSAVVLVGGSTDCATAALSVGTHSVTAVYSGDANYVTSTSSPRSQIVNKAATTTTMTSSPGSPSASGQSVTFTAAIAVTAPGSGTPSGTVTFTKGATTLCSNVAVSNSKATCTTNSLNTGQYTITGTYSGDASFTTSSGSMTQNVSAYASSTAVASSKSTSVLGESITFTATVTPAAGPGVSGTVTFTDGATTLCNAVALSGSPATATCSTSSLTVGSHTITATYSGDTNYGQSSGTVAQTVNKAGTATAVTTSKSPTVWGESATFTATVSVTAPAVSTPTGSVTFTDGATTLCNAVALSGDTASCTTSALSAGSHTVTAAYSGDANDAVSQGTVAQTVDKAATATAVTTSKTPTVSGEAVTFTAAVSVTAPGAGSPGGTVAFSDGGSAIAGCSAKTVSGGTATCTTTALSAGAHTINALYTGSANTEASSASVAQTVNKAATSTALASSANPSTAGQSVTFTATIAVTAPGGGTPGGTVTFTDNGATLCAVAASGGTASCTSSGLSQGSHSIKAAYGGNAAFSASTSGTLTQTVNAAPKTGYWMVTRNGVVYGFGSAKNIGNAPTTTAVDIEPNKTLDGYWIVDEVGHVFGYNAPYLGGASGLRKGEIVTSISSSKSGQGYWLFTSQGRALPFGDAPHLPDMSGTPLQAPVLDSVVTPSGQGYYMVASDGGVFCFGDAVFTGSMVGTVLNAPVQSLVPDPDGSGYWLVASDGGVFSFSAGFHESMGGQHLNAPITGMVAYGDGYLMVGEDGGLFDFSNKLFEGSLANNPPTSPIVSVAALDAK